MSKNDVWLNRNGGQLSELDGTEWLYPPGACEHRKIIKMSNWSTEKTKRAPRTKSIQAPNGDN